jgi:hypothetical protein
VAGELRMSEETKAEVKENPEVILFSEFLESTPPSNLTNILDLAVDTKKYPPDYELLAPEIQLHCPNDACNGTRFFRCTDGYRPSIPDSEFKFLYISYICSNCHKTTKTFSLAAQRDKGSTNSGKCYKFGELPVYGPPTPARLIKLIGPDREVFLKGRRCENQGLGIGAFVYYRRVVENQKNRIIDEIVKVSKKLAVDTKIIAMLEAAKAETQFKRALESLKDAMPQSLLINGHNPLTLLHSALSDGLHDKSDEHCLEIASSIRVVLAELSERLAQALKDEVELNNALSRIMGVKKDS